MSVASSSGCSSLIGYENNNETNRHKMKKHNQHQHQPLLVNGGNQSIIGSTNNTICGSTTSSVVSGSVAGVVGGKVITSATNISGNGKTHYHSKKHHHHSKKVDIDNGNSGCGRSHLNSLWSVWYGFFGTLLQAYTAVKCARRFLREYYNFF